MKKYGVNWGLILAANLICIWPLNAWIGDLLQFPAGSPSHRHWYYFVQSIALSGVWTFMFSLGYDKTLNDPDALAKVRWKTCGRLAESRFRWLIMWVGLVGFVAVVSVGTKLVVGRPAWYVILIYCLGLPVAVLAWAWLVDRAAMNGDLAQKLKSVGDGPTMGSC